MLFGYEVEEFKPLTEVFSKMISFLLDLQHYCAALFLPENPKVLKEIKCYRYDARVAEWQLS